MIPLDLRLKRFEGVPLAGVVLDEAGEPVPGALVLSMAGWGSYGLSLTLRVRSDEAGRFEIPRWQGPHNQEPRLLLTPALAAFAEGHQPGVFMGELPEKGPLVLRLSDGVRVSGRVRFKDSGAPAAGVPVMLRGTPADNDLPDIVIRTDESGAFVFERLCPFPYQLVIYEPEAGYTATEHPRLNLMDGEDEVGLEMELSRGATISGRVSYEETGEPIPGVRLWIPNVRDPRVLREAQTGPDGIYRLEHLPVGEFQVVYDLPDGVVREIVSVDENPLGERRVVKVGPDEQATGVDFAFERGVCVSGRVVDQEGRPVAGARLQASNRHRGRPLSRRLSTSEAKTAADGTYHLWGFAPSEEWLYQMTVSAEGYGRIESDSFEVLGAISGKDFVMQKCAVLSGRVVDERGRPVPMAWISLKPAEGQTAQRLPDAIGDVDGRFAMSEGVYPGTYTFELSSMDMGFNPYQKAAAANPPLRVEGPEDIGGLELVLPDEKPVK